MKAILTLHPFQILVGRKYEKAIETLKNDKDENFGAKEKRTQDFSNLCESTHQNK